MPHFEDAREFLIKEFVAMTRGYIDDPGYQMATVLHPEHGPKYFVAYGSGKN